MKIFTDGASRGNPGPAAGGMVVGKHKYGVCFGIATNNVAEYRALLSALDDAMKQHATEIEIFSDSMLMVKQLNGEWSTNSPVLNDYRKTIMFALVHLFSSWTITHIPREENTEADQLANDELDRCEKRELVL